MPLTLAISLALSTPQLSNYQHLSIHLDLMFHPDIKRCRQLVFPKTDLDHDFPIRRGTNQHIVGGINNEIRSDLTKLAIVEYKLEKSVRVEEQSDGMKWLKPIDRQKVDRSGY